MFITLDSGLGPCEGMSKFNCFCNCLTAVYTTVSGICPSGATLDDGSGSSGEIVFEA